MQQISNEGLQKFLSPRREISCYIEMNLEDSYEILRKEQIYNWKIERNAEDSKFFGTGVCQKMTLETIMTNFGSQVRTINPVSGVSGFTFSTPLFYITEVIQDEVANKITYTAYDGLYFATLHKIKEANLPSTYTIKELAEKAVALIPELSGVDTSSLNLPFTSANLSGEETCREIFDDIAEATQTNYYVNSENILCFKRINTIVSVNIPKTAYFEATTGAVYVLKTIMSVTELGDNASSTATGSPDVSGIEVTQYVRENCFYTQLKDTQIKNALQYAINNVGICMSILLSGEVLQQQNLLILFLLLIEMGFMLKLSCLTILFLIMEDLLKKVLGLIKLRTKQKKALVLVKESIIPLPE